MTRSDVHAGFDSLLDVAPIGVVVVDQARNIIAANPHARALLGCDIGTPIAGCVRKEDAARLDDLFAHPDEVIALRLGAIAGGKTIEARTVAEAGDPHPVIFLNDISEKVALGRQLRSSRQPSRTLLYRLHAAATTMSGYVELIDLMLAEQEVFTVKKLNVIRRYHHEVRKSLETITSLLQVEREGGRRPDATAIPIRRKEVVVIDAEPAVAEFIGELMQGLRYRVSSFTEAAGALAYCVEHRDRIDLVIVDHGMRGPGGAGVFGELLAQPGKFFIVVCAENAADVEESSRMRLCHKPIDITELTLIVADLMEA